MLSEHLQRPDPLLRQHDQPLHIDPLPTPDAEQLRTLDQVLDLAPIQPDLNQPVEVCLADLERVVAQMPDEVPPHLPPRLGVEVAVRQEQINPRLERVVNAGDAVGRQE